MLILPIRRQVLQFMSEVHKHQTDCGEMDEWWTTCQCWIKKRDENASGHASAFFRLETAVWSVEEVSDLIKNPLIEAFRCS